MAVLDGVGPEYGSYSIRKADCLGVVRGGNTLWRMLSREEIAILDFERRWGQTGPKDPLIEGVLGLTSARYYELLGRLVSERAALAYDPLTVKRVLRLIEGQPEVAAS